jgi:hypothetical protein
MIVDELMKLYEIKLRSYSIKKIFLSCAMKSCMTDGGRPSGDGLQEQLPNRPELHMLRAYVVSVREKVFLRGD